MEAVADTLPGERTLIPILMLIATTSFIPSTLHISYDQALTVLTIYVSPSLLSLTAYCNWLTCGPGPSSSHTYPPTVLSRPCRDDAVSDSTSTGLGMASYRYERTLWCKSRFFVM